MNQQDKKYTEAARSLISNPAYQLLRTAMIEELSKVDHSILSASDVIVSRSHVHDIGIRNFFRWVDRVASDSDDVALDQVLHPFEHYTNQENN